MGTVLITGGSGLIGTALTRDLLATGWNVHYLGRRKIEKAGVRSFVWDIKKGVLDKAGLDWVDHIIHLAGSGIAEERWTTHRVKELVSSRTETARLLLDTVRTERLHIKSFTSAAGIGYYGAQTSPHIYTETDAAGNDTIATISKLWESAVDEWKPFTRVVKLRTPLVLSSEGGALTQLRKPVDLGLGAPLGTGRQWMPWVHIDDLVRAYIHSITTESMHGAFNVSASGAVTNTEFMKTLGRTLQRRQWLPPVPGFLLKLVLGKLSEILLEGSRASNTKLLETGFAFEYNELPKALSDLLE